MLCFFPCVGVFCYRTLKSLISFAQNEQVPAILTVWLSGRSFVLASQVCRLFLRVRRLAVFTMNCRRVETARGMCGMRAMRYKRWLRAPTTPVRFGVSLLLTGVPVWYFWSSV
jgi:hypothetical protein